MQPSSRGQASLLLAPWALAALAVLVLNDHWLKHAWPGVLSGKLSDVAGLALFPALLHDAWLWLSRRPTERRARRAVAIATLLTAVTFAAVKLWPPAGELYRWGLAAAQWPFFAARAALGGRGWPALAPVALVQDATDLLALPFTALALATFPSRRSSSGPSPASPPPSSAPASGA